jgi:hypothetical protein
MIRERARNVNTQSAKSSHRQPIPIYAPGKDKAIGKVIGDAFVKHISFRKHTLRQPAAIAFDLSTLDDAEAAGAKNVEVHDTDTGHLYTAPMQLIRTKGLRVNRGFGSQWALTLGYWRKDDAPSEMERQTEAQAAKAKAASMKQLGLFGGDA